MERHKAGVGGRSERALQMLQSEQPAGRVEADPDRVEAQLWPPRAIPPAPGEPFARHRPHLRALARADRREWAERSVRAADDARLDLAEDQKAIVGRDEIELAVSGAEVPVDDLEPARLEMDSREPLALRTKSLSRVASHRRAKLGPGGAPVCDLCDNSLRPR